MKIEVLGKTYEVLEIIEKKHCAHDLFVCRAPAGYRECFQRIDIGRLPRKAVVIDKHVSWNYDEIAIIKNRLAEGLLPSQIAKIAEITRHTPQAVENKARAIKRHEQEKETKPRFNIKF